MCAYKSAPNKNAKTTFFRENRSNIFHCNNSMNRHSQFLLLNYNSYSLSHKFSKMLFMKSKREFSLNHITIELIQQVIFKFLCGNLTNYCKSTNIYVQLLCSICEIFLSNTYLKYKHIHAFKQLRLQCKQIKFSFIKMFLFANMTVCI